MQYSHLTDDDLWCGITKNTNAMSTLYDQQLEAGTSALLQTRATVVIDNLEREYLTYAAELRSRHSLILNSETAFSVRSDRAA